MVRIAQFERRSTLNKKQMMRIARLTLVVAGALTMTGYAEARNGSNKIVLVSPAELPELARATGQAMTLHTTADGRTLLYVERNDGARLAIFDVTDPAKIKQKPKEESVRRMGPSDPSETRRYQSETLSNNPYCIGRIILLCGS
jgi:hypothetical protein